MGHSRRIATALLIAGVTLGALAACATNSTPASTATATHSKSRSATATPSRTPTSAATATSSASASSSTGTTVQACGTGNLTGGTAAGSGGAAGSTAINLTLKNTGSTACTLQGWPGVSFVGDSNGTQIGAAATFDRTSAHPLVTLQPGQTANAPLKVTNAANYADDECSPTEADGFRVYPPGSKASLFIADSTFTACGSKSTKLLQVKGIVAQG